MRVAITGAAGQLGSELMRAFSAAGWETAGLSRPAFRLEEPTLDVEADLVVNAAAWTDVDGCARDPVRAMRLNAVAPAKLASRVRDMGARLVQVSTNEVFDGRRIDGRPYLPTDDTAPPNPYGASKLAGEQAATAAFDGAAAALGIARTAWLYGPPGPDFPRKILEAADRAQAAGEPLRAVADEWGTPTYAADVADAIVELLAADSHRGIHHLVGGGVASRADWARDIVARFRLTVRVEDVPATTWARASVPPRWGVLAPTPLPSGEPIRPWTQAMADYAPTLERARGSAR